MHGLRVNTRHYAPRMRYFPHTRFYFTWMEITDPTDALYSYFFRARILHTLGL